jgi:hypothetical protein
MQLSYYYANESGEPVGPFDAREMQRLARIGTIQAQTLVITSQGSEWTQWSNLRPTMGQFNALPQQVEVNLVGDLGLARPSSASAPPLVQAPPPIPELLPVLPQIGPLARAGRPSSDQVKNLAVKLSLSGGIIGSLTTNPASAIQNAFDTYNRRGWRCVQVIHHSDTNILGIILKVAVLVLTLFLWTWSSAYILVFEKQEAE